MSLRISNGGSRKRPAEDGVPFEVWRDSDGVLLRRGHVADGAPYVTHLTDQSPRQRITVQNVDGRVWASRRPNADLGYSVRLPPSAAAHAIGSQLLWRAPPRSARTPVEEFYSERPPPQAEAAAEPGLRIYSNLHTHGASGKRFVLYQRGVVLHEGAIPRDARGSVGFVAIVCCAAEGEPSQRIVIQPALGAARVLSYCEYGPDGGARIMGSEVPARNPNALRVDLLPAL